MTKVIVALDFPTQAEALSMVDILRPDIEFFKVGLELFVASGPDVVRAVKDRGAAVFLDLKFNDIPNTVRGASACAARLGVDIISVHTGIGREGLVAARQGVDEAAGPGRRPVVAGVTVLTSLGGGEPGRDGEAAGGVLQRVLGLSRLAVECGLNGIITSVREAAEVRKAVGPEPVIITPGIRLPDSAEDHKRTGTVAEAVAAGADFLVVGRPITRASDLKGQARKFIEEVARTAGKPRT